MATDAASPSLAAVVEQLLTAPDPATTHRYLTTALAQFDHDRFLTALKDASEQHRATDAPAALKLAEALIAAAALAQRPDHAAMGLMARGDAARVLGHFQEAVRDLDEAGRRFLDLGDETGWARTRLGWLVAAYYLGDGAAALASMPPVRAVLQRAAMPLRVGILELNCGWVCWKLGRHREALAHFARAEQEFTTLGTNGEQQLAWARGNAAIVHTELGEFTEALRLHEEVREFWERCEQPLLVAQIDQNIAYVHAGQGYFTRALRSYRVARAAQQQASQPVEAAWTALNIIDCYLQLNFLDQAIALAEETVTAFEECGSPVGAARARFAGAIARRRAGDHQGALALLDDALPLFAASELQDERALAILERAALLLAASNSTGALAAAAAAAESFATRGLPLRHAQANLLQGQALLGLRQFDAAAALARGALATGETHQAAWILPEAHLLLARIARTSDRGGDAAGEYARATGAIEQLQRSLAIDLRTNFLADKDQVYAEAATLHLDLDEPARALSYLERAKSRALLDYLSNHLEISIGARPGSDPDLLAELTRLRAEHNWHYQQLHRPLRRDEALAQTTPDPTTLQAAIHDRERQIAHLLEQLALDRTEGLQLATDGELDTADLLQHLPPGIALLEYALLDDRSVLFVARQQGLTVVPLDDAHATLHRVLQSWHLNLAATARALASGQPLVALTRNARAILGALYRILLAPAAPLLAGCERLIVVPHGPLHAIPFSALHDGECFAIERWEVVVSPTSGLLPLCQERARQRATAHPTVLALAHSDDGRLPQALAEAEAILKLLPGARYIEEAATRATLARHAPDHPIVHLAAHGEARLDNPAFAHLQLADGQLTMTDIFNLQLDGALVVLSACESGRSAIAGGDELLGLTRGFLYAGAATIVQSLWRVEDAATAALMSAFYQALRDNRPKGAALRDAQLALLRDAAPPYYWAAFQLIGDSGPLGPPGA